MCSQEVAKQFQHLWPDEVRATRVTAPWYPGAKIMKVADSYTLYI